MRKKGKMLSVVTKDPKPRNTAAKFGSLGDGNIQEDNMMGKSMRPFVPMPGKRGMRKRMEKAARSFLGG